MTIKQLAVIFGSIAVVILGYFFLVYIPANDRRDAEFQRVKYENKQRESKMQYEGCVTERTGQLYVERLAANPTSQCKEDVNCLTTLEKLVRSRAEDECIQKFPVKKR